VPAPAPGKWRATGELVTARAYHTATLLLNGQVLVTGGVGEDGLTALASAELYDPATGVWTETGSMANARYYHTMTLLPNGQVLVAGGFDDHGAASAELYDPATGLWTETGSLTTGRILHTATLLPNGKVLVAGGYGLYLLKGKPVFLYNFVGLERFRWDGPATLGPGKHTIAFDFKYDGPGPGKGGTGVLTVDGKEVANKKIPHTTPFIITADETFDVGVDTRTGVDDKDYQVPFRFTGKLTS
jgi:Galactose oxidase, central domain